MDALTSRRTPLQGLRNVVRFNWPFYALALGAALLAGLAGARLPAPASSYAALALAVVLSPVLLSLLVTAYVYDFSSLYQLDWLPLPTALPYSPTVLTFSAGFDEISPLLQARYQPGALLALDFYDPARHTEASIRRARQAYPPLPGMRVVSTLAPLPLPDYLADLTVLFMAAHEIRDAAERAAFFREVSRVTKPTGRIVVVEHLRDAANFLAYTVGFLHFHSPAAWGDTFRAAGLRVVRAQALTPFVSAFSLTPHGASA